MSEQAGGAGGLAVEADLLAYRGECRGTVVSDMDMVAGRRIIRGGGISGGQIADDGGDGLAAALGDAGYIGGGAGGGGVKVDDFAGVGGAERLADGEGVDGLEQGGFALGVGAGEHGDARRQFQLGLPEIAVVGQRKPRQIGQRNTSRAGFGFGVLGVRCVVAAKTGGRGRT